MSKNRQGLPVRQSMAALVCLGVAVGTGVAFLAPEIGIVPARRLPPSMCAGKKSSIFTSVASRLM